MAQEVQALMATRLALDTMPASRALNGLKQSVNVVTNAWKAQSEAQRTAGDELGAQKTKVEGLSNAISRQKEYIAKLTDNQQHYIDVAKNFKTNQTQVAEEIKKTKAAMSEEASESSKSSEKYKELNERLKELKATQRDIQNNGGHLMTVTRQIENAKAKLAGMEAQAKRADETLKTMNPSGLNRIRSAAGKAMSAIAGIHPAAERVKGAFAGTAVGVAAGNAISSAWNGVKMTIGGVIAAGMSYNRQQQVMQATWDTLMGSADKAKGMRNNIVQLSNALGQPVQLTNELSMQFYHVFDNAPETQTLTKSFLTMGDAIGLTSDRLQQVGLDFTHMLSSGKMQLGDFNQITDAFPMYANALLDYERKIQNNSQLTMDQLRKQMSDGKISAKDAETVMNNLGQNYHKASENLMGTIEGLHRQIKAKASQLAGDITKPVTEKESPIYKQVGKWVADPKTDEKFTELGKKVNRGLMQVMRAFNINGNTNVTAGLDRGVERIGDVVSRVFSEIASHAQTIKATFTLFRSVGSLIRTVFVTAIKQAITVLSSLMGIFNRSGNKSQTTAQKLNGISTAIRKITANKGEVQALAALAGSIYGMLKLSQMINGLKRMSDTLHLVTGAQRAWNIVAGMSPLGRAITVITALIAITVELYKHCKPFREFVNWAGRNIVGVMRGILNTATTVNHNLVAAWNSVKSATRSFVSGFKSSLTGAISFLKNNWKTILGYMTSPVLTGLAQLYQHNPRFRAWANNLASQTMSGLNGLGTKFKTFFTKTLPDSITSAKDAISDAAQKLIKWLFSPVEEALKGFEGVYNKVAEKMHLPTLDASLPGYASGKSGDSQGEIAVVNDAQSSHWREMLRYSDGQLVPLPKIRNLKTYIPAGAQVIDGETAHQLAKAHGIKNYASGSSSETSSNGQLTSLVNGLNDYGQGTRNAVMNEFMKKMNQVFRTNLNKFRKAIRDANAEMKQTIKQAVAQMQQTIRQAMQTYHRSAMQAKQTRDKSINQAAQTKRQKDAEVQQTFTQKVNDANSTKSSKLQDAEQTKSDQDGDAQDTYNDKVQDANQTWQSDQAKYKDKPDKLAQARQSWQNKLSRAQSKLNEAQGKHQRHYEEAVSSANSTASSAVSAATSGKNSGAAAAQSDYGSAVGTANSTFADSINSAKSTLNNSISTARNTERQAEQKARRKRDKAVRLAQANIRSLQQWRSDNQRQLGAGMAEFAHGGLADRPSIFGEAGPEMAIPLNDASSGRAWQLLQHVVDYYAGANPAQQTPNNSSTSDAASRQLVQKFDQMLGFMQQLVSGQARQTAATKGITGYDQSKAFQDFSSNFRAAQTTNLTY